MSALLSLACAFPPAHALRGACTTIADLQHDFYACDPLFVQSKQEAVRLIVAANMERITASGYGNKAAKRAVIAEETALTAKREASFLTFDQSTRRMKLQRQRQLADEQTEHYAEARKLKLVDKLMARDIE